jgi:hypothetical protein
MSRLIKLLAAGHLTILLVMTTAFLAGCRQPIPPPPPTTPPPPAAQR